jgi:hypothetical protein
VNGPGGRTVTHPSQEETMATLFIRHRVRDYAGWRRVYDDVGPMRTRAGVLGQAVYQAEGDANDVTVTHDFQSPAAAQAFAGSTELREAMAKAGVEGAPTSWLTERV